LEQETKIVLNSVQFIEVGFADVLGIRNLNKSHQFLGGLRPGISTLVIRDFAALFKGDCSAISVGKLKL